MHTSFSFFESGSSCARVLRKRRGSILSTWTPLPSAFKDSSRYYSAKTVPSRHWNFNRSSIKFRLPSSLKPRSALTYHLFPELALPETKLKVRWCWRMSGVYNVCIGKVLWEETLEYSYLALFRLNHISRKLIFEYLELFL